MLQWRFCSLWVVFWAVPRPYLSQAKLASMSNQRVLLHAHMQGIANIQRPNQELRSRPLYTTSSIFPDLLPPRRYQISLRGNTRFSRMDWPGADYPALAIRVAKGEEIRHWTRRSEMAKNNARYHTQEPISEFNPSC